MCCTPKSHSTYLANACYTLEIESFEALQLQRQPLVELTAWCSVHHFYMFGVHVTQTVYVSESQTGFQLIFVGGSMFTATANLHVDLTLTSLFQILNINGHWFD